VLGNGVPEDEELGMNDPMKDAWNQVAEGFASLGRRMKDRYEVDEAERPAPPEDADAAGAALREAFERFVAAGRDVGQRAVDVLRDDDVKAQAKQAATTLNDALSVTVDTIGREVGGLFGRRGQRADETGTDDDPTVVGVPEDMPEAVRPSATGLVTGPVEEEPDVVVGDVDRGKPDET
jgi:hypothetical protein